MHRPKGLCIFFVRIWFLLIKLRYLIMKHILLILLAIFVTGSQLSAQESYKEEVTWMGLDFTHAKLINRTAFTNSRVIKDSYLTKWNNIIFNEPKKFNISKYFGIRSVKFDISEVTDRNSKIKHQSLVVDHADKLLQKDEIKEIIAQYPKAEGVGLLLLVESFNKNNTTGTYWACFFNRATSEVLSVQKIAGHAKGIGIRNYWANSLYQAMKRYDN
ncbi:MAG: hypothetical protein COC06_00150 [Bacteroidales bacterium]|nr:MAG: hypothetical protein COC06_00150 [Bacteroidales bacterium]